MEYYHQGPKEMPAFATIPGASEGDAVLIRVCNLPLSPVFESKPTKQEVNGWLEQTLRQCLGELPEKWYPSGEETAHLLPSEISSASHVNNQGSMHWKRQLLQLTFVFHEMRNAEMPTRESQSSDLNNLRQAIKLMLLTHMMAQLARVPDNKKDMLGCFRSMSVSKNDVVSARVVERYMKFRIRKMVQCLAETVLKGINSALRQQPQLGLPAWGETFAATFIMLAIAASIQTSLDEIAMFDAKASEYCYDREEASRDVAAMNTNLCGDLVSLFHLKFKDDPRDEEMMRDRYGSATAALAKGCYEATKSLCKWYYVRDDRRIYADYRQFPTAAFIAVIILQIARSFGSAEKLRSS